MKVGRRIRSRHWWLILFIALSAFTISRAYEPVLEFTANWLDVGERPRPADFVMVLPGGPERRPFVAAAMIRAGLVRGVLTPQTELSTASAEGLAPETDEVMRRVLKLRGVRDDQIEILPGRSKSTWTDAVALSRFLSERPDTTIAIATDGCHTRRARWVFRRVLGEKARRIYFVSAPSDTVFAKNWWTTEEGLVTYLAEYSKFLVYVVTDRQFLVIVTGMGIAVVSTLFLIRKKRFFSFGGTGTMPAKPC